MLRSLETKTGIYQLTGFTNTLREATPLTFFYLQKMKEYVCIKDFYIEDVIFAKEGDKITLLPDNSTVVNTSSDGQKVAYNAKFIVESDNFVNTEEMFPVEEVKEDNVNHPKHYTSHPSGIECIEITRHYCFDVGNAIKYLWRAGLKKEMGLEDKQKEIEDLKKAIWYINDRIKQLEND